MIGNVALAGEPPTRRRLVARGRAGYNFLGVPAVLALLFLAPPLVGLLIKAPGATRAPS